jgi:23S rRNA pseudouridine1911/1915/1917 synthase
LPSRTELIVTAGETPKRLDLFLANRDTALSRSALQRLIQNGRITINHKAVKPSQKIKPGDRIVLDIPKPEPLELEPEPIPLEVLYEDASLLVLNKPAGLVVHTARATGPARWSMRSCTTLASLKELCPPLVGRRGRDLCTGLIRKLPA